MSCLVAGVWTSGAGSLNALAGSLALGGALQRTSRRCLIKMSLHKNISNLISGQAWLALLSAVTVAAVRALERLLFGVRPNMT